MIGYNCCVGASVFSVGADESVGFCVGWAPGWGVFCAEGSGFSWVGCGGMDSGVIDCGCVDWGGTGCGGSCEGNDCVADGTAVGELIGEYKGRFVLLGCEGNGDGNLEWEGIVGSGVIPGCCFCEGCGVGCWAGFRAEFSVG